jgi:hypothetical protein
MRPFRGRLSRLFPPTVVDILAVLGVSWLVRAIVIATWPLSAHSDDLDSWKQVAQQLTNGANPYVTTTIVKWPPFALLVVWVIDRIARVCDISFFLAMRLTLIAAESAIVVVLYLLLTRYAPARAVRRLLIVGISLNPIAILFVCQHENIDVFVGLFVVLALWALATYIDTGDPVAWLAGCLALGLGAFAKTIPLILVPLLAPGFRAASRLGRTLGAALFLGPVVLGLGVVFVLAPRAVFDNVVRYRSISGYFGVTGALRAVHLDRLNGPYGSLFIVLLVLGVLMVFRAAWYRGLAVETTVLLAGLLLMTVPVLGPGYAPQYAYWYLPPLLATYVLLDREWRRILLVSYGIAAVTYVVEYALVGSQGRFLVAFFPGSARLENASERLSSPGAQTLLRLPLFVAFLVLLVAGARRLHLLRSPPAEELVSVPP